MYIHERGREPSKVVDTDKVPARVGTSRVLTQGQVGPTLTDARRVRLNSTSETKLERLGSVALAGYHRVASPLRRTRIVHSHSMPCVCNNHVENETTFPPRTHTTALRAGAVAKTAEAVRDPPLPVYISAACPRLGSCGVGDIILNEGISKYLIV